MRLLSACILCLFVFFSIGAMEITEGQYRLVYDEQPKQIDYCSIYLKGSDAFVIYQHKAYGIGKLKVGKLHVVFEHDSWKPFTLDMQVKDKAIRGKMQIGPDMTLTCVMRKEDRKVPFSHREVLKDIELQLKAFAKHGDVLSRIIPKPGDEIFKLLSKGVKQRNISGMEAKKGSLANVQLSDSIEISLSLKFGHYLFQDEMKNKLEKSVMAQSDDDAAAKLVGLTYMKSIVQRDVTAHTSLFDEVYVKEQLYSEEMVSQKLGKFLQLLSKLSGPNGRFAFTNHIATDNEIKPVMKERARLHLKRYDKVRWVLVENENPAFTFILTIGFNQKQGWKILEKEVLVAGIIRKRPLEGCYYANMGDGLIKNPARKSSVSYIKKKVLPNLKPLSEERYLKDFAKLLYTAVPKCYLVVEGKTLWIMEYAGLTAVSFSKDKEVQFVSIANTEANEDIHYQIIFDSHDELIEGNHKHWTKVTKAEEKLVDDNLVYVNALHQKLDDKDPAEE